MAFSTAFSGLFASSSVVAYGAQAARVARVAVGLLLGQLGAGQGDLVGVDDDDEVAGVDVGREGRLVLAAQQDRGLGGETAQDDVGRVDDVPLARDLAGLGGVRTHGRSLRSLVMSLRRWWCVRPADRARDHSAAIRTTTDNDTGAPRDHKICANTPDLSTNPAVSRTVRRFVQRKCARIVCIHARRSRLVPEAPAGPCGAADAGPPPALTAPGRAAAARSRDGHHPGCAPADQQRGHQLPPAPPRRRRGGRGPRRGHRPGAGLVREHTRAAPRGRSRRRRPRRGRRRSRGARVAGTGLPAALRRPGRRLARGAGPVARAVARRRRPVGPPRAGDPGAAGRPAPRAGGRAPALPPGRRGQPRCQTGLGLPVPAAGGPAARWTGRRTDRAHRPPRRRRRLPRRRAGPPASGNAHGPPLSRDGPCARSVLDEDGHRARRHGHRPSARIPAGGLDHGVGAAGLHR